MTAEEGFFGDLPHEPLLELCDCPDECVVHTVFYYGLSRMGGEEVSAKCICGSLLPLRPCTYHYTLFYGLVKPLYNSKEIRLIL